ncbi:MAG: DUF370 domain-containing protein [Clostridiales bacterium]|jgi:hypothetical protein|nr:DUF370 domain-containing protein [Clostridiales bacterium]
MYLHIGGGVTLAVKEIAAIISAEAANSEDTQAFLEARGLSGKYVDISDGKPRSFVISDEAAYATQISAKTLRGRLEQGMATLSEMPSATK